MKILTLARMEIRRFMRSRLTAAALAVLCVVPLLYGALYLYAFWDPYGRLNHIPAALVVEDRTATAQDGTQLLAGHESRTDGDSPTPWTPPPTRSGRR